MNRSRCSVLCAFLALLLGCSDDNGSGLPGQLIAGEGPKNACTSSSDCDGAKDLCEVEVLRCVGCIDDGDCQADKPACNYREGECRECTDDRYCSGNEPVCDTVKQTCQPRCTKEGDCRTKELPECDLETGRCIACRADADCSDRKKPVCDPNGVCVACSKDVPCGEKNRVCIAPQGECEECAAASDCGPDKPYCLDFHCRECLSNADCGADAPRCGDDAKCTRCECDPNFGDCSTGECICSDGLSACGALCADLDNDPRHCGSCDRKCEDDSMCSGGECVCRPGLLACDRACVDPDTDPAHCGGCGKKCDGRCAGGVCSADTCESQNALGCGEQDAACVAKSSLPDHPLHCGECDRRCHEDQACVEGECRAYTPGRSCTTCPCEDCGSEACCPHPLASGWVFCVAASSCPGML